jgi:hypothetical protein
VIAALAVMAAEIFPAHGQERSTLPVPIRLSAWAVNMSNVGPGTTAAMEIEVTRWTTSEEREDLIATFVEKKQDALLRALQRTPEHGRMRIPGWVGSDPHQVRLGWTLRYAWQAALPEGGYRIVIATDRYIGFWEARNKPRTTDYPFTFLEIRLGKDGDGEGKMAVATKLKFDKKKNVVELENFASEPVRLQRVRREKG